MQTPVPETKRQSDRVACRQDLEKRGTVIRTFATWKLVNPLKVLHTRQKTLESFQNAPSNGFIVPHVCVTVTTNKNITDSAPLQKAKWPCYQNNMRDVTTLNHAGHPAFGHWPPDHRGVRSKRLVFVQQVDQPGSVTGCRWLWFV